ncbi:Uma2 family endonuclease [Anabaena azotica]|uniref:Uma2 family endonuclease n=1 Tax=Anabaena azotica FACHB-119 TaxID=947527 RepID=A0ABR8D204_9NOST|nr:Uma2 family endonuclease [Anabaena azotica]MBD2501220.1 Uma2 family endonuclease [Anabaena azotica FACHB-119]
MTAMTKPKLTFNQFLEQCPEEGFYELVNGEIVELISTRNHEDVADSILFAFKSEIRRINLNYVVKNTPVIKTKTADGIEQGRKPDVSVIDRDVWLADRSAYAALAEPIQLAVEVTSTNWEDDYIDKLDEYERLGIPEYWIVDYLGIGDRKYLGTTEEPIVFIHLLNNNGKYERTSFQGSDRIISRTFLELTLTAEQVLTA